MKRVDSQLVLDAQLREFTDPVDKTVFIDLLIRTLPQKKGPAQTVFLRMKPEMAATIARAVAHQPSVLAVLEAPPDTGTRQ